MEDVVKRDQLEVQSDDSYVTYSDYAKLQQRVQELEQFKKGVTPKHMQLLQRAEQAEAHRDIPKFNKTWCSQCGQEFGPGYSGYSHCSSHRIAAPTRARDDAKRERDLRLIVEGCLESAEKEVEALRSLEEQVVDAIMSHYKGIKHPAGMAIIHSIRAIYRNVSPPPAGGEKEDQ